jgi:hypothetical protein
MEPYAEFTKLEQWDENGKPFLAEVCPQYSVYIEQVADR